MRIKTQIKKITPSFILNCHKQFISLLDLIKGKIGHCSSVSGFTSTLYYTLISSAFMREHQAVLSGKKRFYAQLKNGNTSAYLLRRNIHRLEKGLIMKPRRSFFADSYILETVICFKILSKKKLSEKTIDLEQLQWASDVLNVYFDVVDIDLRIDEARKIFLSGEILEVVSDVEKAPYMRKTSVSNTINYKQFVNLSKRRRSVRWYLNKPVPRDLIDDAIVAASYAPSACNRQPFEYRIYDEIDLVRKVINVPGGTSGWSESPPVVIAVVGQLRAYTHERDRHLIYIDSSLSSMAFMLALETLGLSSCAINFPDIKEKNIYISKILSLEPDEVVVMLVSVGFADKNGCIPFSQKKEVAMLRSYNKH